MTNQEPQPKQPRMDTNGREGKARKTNRRLTQIQGAWPWLAGETRNRSLCHLRAGSRIGASGHESVRLQFVSMRIRLHFAP
jgi:hypothetical protein